MAISLMIYSAYLQIHIIEPIQQLRFHLFTPFQGQVIEVVQNNYPQKLTIMLFQQGKIRLSTPVKVRLGYYSSGELSVGEQVTFTAKLKPLIYAENPYSFDYGRYLLSQHIVASGYIKGAIAGEAKHHAQSLDSEPKDKWLAVLMHGDKRRLNTNDWQILQQTGTAHLFVISGLHIGIIITYMWLLSKFILYALLRVTVFRSFLIVNCQSMQFLLSVSLSLLVISQIQFALPMFRALLASIIYLITLHMLVNWSVLEKLKLVLLAIVISDPLVSLQMSFWLSLSMVASIILITKLWTVKGRWRQFSILQLLLSLFALLNSWYWFGQLAWFAWLINLCLIPLFTFLIIPLVMTLLFAKLVLPTTWLDPVYSVLESWLQNGFSYLSLINDTLPFSYLKSPDLALVMLIGLLLVSSLFVWRLAYWRLGQPLIIMLMCILVARQLHAPSEQQKMVVFAVGQGNSQLLVQRKKAVLFDTGNQFASGFNYIEAVVLPFLRAEGLSLEAIWISHLDNDHSGGLATVKMHFPDVRVYSPQQGCYRGQRSHLGTVSWRVLWPLGPQAGTENNQSCVILLQLDSYTMLLPGDIEKEAERALLKDLTKVDILVSPHHGSKTSSTPAFVEGLQAPFVIHSQGRFNRYHFPHQQVTSSYANYGQQWQTGRDGAIFINWQNSLEIMSWQQLRTKRWYHSVTQPSL